jgi:hypothetical protein
MKKNEQHKFIQNVKEMTHINSEKISVIYKWKKMCVCVCVAREHYYMSHG